MCVKANLLDVSARALRASSIHPDASISSKMSARDQGSAGGFTFARQETAEFPRVDKGWGGA